MASTPQLSRVLSVTNRGCKHGQIRLRTYTHHTSGAPSLADGNTQRIGDQGGSLGPAGMSCLQGLRAYLLISPGGAGSDVHRVQVGQHQLDPHGV